MIYHWLSSIEVELYLNTYTVIDCISTATHSDNKHNGIAREADGVNIQESRILGTLYHILFSFEIHWNDRRASKAIIIIPLSGLWVYYNRYGHIILLV